MEDQILQTKLQPPQVKGKILRRERLLNFLQENLDKKLILICADAGYGKTTLLIQLVENQRFPYIFYDLDNSDSDFVVFMLHLIYAFKQIQSDLVIRTDALLKQRGSILKNFELIMTTLINELAEKRKEELFIILDDYHNLDKDSLVHRALEFFINRMPDVIHLIIASRNKPPFRFLPKWQVCQNLFVLSRDELRFSEKEMRILLSEIYSIHLTDADFKLLFEHTEGWITGLQVILQSADKEGWTLKNALNGYLATNELLFNYFASEIFSSLPAEKQTFMKVSALIDIMTPEICNTICKVSNSEMILEELLQNNLFIHKLGQNQYKYHQLFRNFLLAQIKDENYKRNLYREMGYYFIQTGQIEQAIECYLRAGCYEMAAKTMEKVVDDMEERSQFSILERWIGSLPKEILYKFPYLVIILAKRYEDKRQINTASKLCKKAIEIAQSERLNTLSAEAHWVLGDLLLIGRHYYQALKIYRRALRIHPVEESTRAKIYYSLGVAFTNLRKFRKAMFYLRKARYIWKKTGSFQNFIAAESSYIVSLLFQGEYRKSFLLYKNLLELIGNTYRSEFGVVFSNAAWAGITVGETDWVEQILNQGWLIVKDYEDLHSHLALHHATGFLHMHKGNWNSAFEHFQQAVKIRDKFNLKGSLVTLERNFCRFYRYQGDYSKARAYLNQAQKLTASDDCFSLFFNAIEKTLLDISQGRFEDIDKTLKLVFRIAKRLKDKFSEFQALLVNSLILWNKGKRKEAYNSFKYALRLSKDKGYDGFLIQEIKYTPAFADLVQEVGLLKGAEYNYLQGLLERYGILRLLRLLEYKSIKVYFLGKFELFIRGVSKTPMFKRSSTKAIFAFFLLHPEKRFSWEEISAWAWPESPPKTAHQMFLNALSELRKSIPAFKLLIQYQEGGYRLNPESHIFVDVLEISILFEEFLKEKDEVKKITWGEHIVSLYGGPLLPDFYYLWVENLRVSLEERYLSVLRYLAAKYAEKGEYEKSNLYCGKYLEIDKLDEDIHRLLITNYLHSGKKAKAYKQFEKLKKILYEELKIEPSLETCNLFK